MASPRVFTQCYCAAGAIIEKDGKFLLVQEKKSGKFPGAGKWNQPAGWVDVGEDAAVAAAREVREETGLEWEPKGLLGIYALVRNDQVGHFGATPHVFKYIFRGTVVGGELCPQPDEVDEVKWFSPEEIFAMDALVLRDPDIKQEVRDYMAGVSFPLSLIHHTVVA